MKPKPTPPKPKPFTDLTFASEYPVQHTADNEALLSFVNDGDCLAFYDWWDKEGAVQFQRFVGERES